MCVGFLPHLSTSCSSVNLIIPKTRAHVHGTLHALSLRELGESQFSWGVSSGFEVPPSSSEGWLAE